MLVEMFIDGMSASLIAKAINERFGLARSRNSIIGRLHRKKHRRAERQPSTQLRYPNRPITAKAKPVKTASNRNIPLAKPKAVEAGPVGGVTVLDLKFWHCRFPIGGNGADLRHCGAQKLVGGVYCEFHTKVAHQPSSPKRASVWVA